MPKIFKSGFGRVFSPLPTIPESFGEQLYIDEENNIVGEEPILLVHGVQYSVDSVIDETHRFGGCAILAHVDRASFSYVSVLGEVPEDLPVDGIELSRRLTPREAREWLPRLPPAQHRTFFPIPTLWTASKKKTAPACS